MHISNPCKVIILTHVRIISKNYPTVGQLAWNSLMDMFKEMQTSPLSRRCQVWAFHSGWETSPDDSLGGVQT